MNRRQEDGPLPMPQLSIFIIACNEADRIERSINSVRNLSDDIILVDSGSTDETREIASALGARTIHNDWSGYGRQKRFAESQCRHAWRLNLDADEVVTPELKQEIRALLSRRELAVGAYSIRIVEMSAAEQTPRWRAHTHDYVRLYHRDAGQFSASSVHDVVHLKTGIATQRLQGTMHHFAMRSIGDQIDKFNRYTDDLARDLRQRNKTLPTWRVFCELPIAFLKAYVFRFHFTRGTHGFLSAMNYAIFRYLRVAKHYEMRSAHIDPRRVSVGKGGTDAPTAFGGAGSAEGTDGRR